MALLDWWMRDLLRAAPPTGEHERLRTLRDRDAAALPLWDALQVRLDERVDTSAVRSTTLAPIPRQRLVEAGTQVETLTRPPDDPSSPARIERSHSVRRFLPTLLPTVAFQGTPAGQPMLKAWALLRHLEPQRHPDLQSAPLAVVPRAWRRLGKPPQAPGPDRRAYPLGLLERLPDHLRRRDGFVAPRARWGDPRLQWLPGARWEALRPQVCRALGPPEAPEPALQALAQQLDTASQRPAANLPTNAAVRSEALNGRDTLTLTGLAKLDEPPAGAPYGSRSSRCCPGSPSLSCAWQSMPARASPMH